MMRKTKRQYLKDIHQEHEKRAKELGVTLNSNAYRKMEEFAWERYCRDNENVSLNDMFRFKYSYIIGDLIPNQLKLVDRVRRCDFVGDIMKVPIIKE
tara:strand:+ start:712 stop:1002 length:291 start_codon:yes stop_codon:yes gene_type:complete